MSLNLPSDFTLPAYDGGSIANVPATVAALLGAPFSGLPPLRPALWEPLGPGVTRVVLVLLDSLGANLWADGRSLTKPWMERARVRGELTSVFPSTTVAALSSLWTGVAPGQHGLVGLNMLLPEFGAISQMLSLSPTFGRYPDALVRAGLEPQSFLQGRTISEQLADAGVATHAFKGASIANSALSRMHGRGAAGNHGVHAFTELMVRLRAQLEAAPGQPLYLNAYWPSLDTLSHAYTPFHEVVRAELGVLLRQVAELLWRPLSAEARAGTALIIMADHGQLPTPLQAWIDWGDHPHLDDLLLMRPGGEARAAYLYCRQGLQEDTLAYLQEKLGGAVSAFPVTAALESGLFGPPPFAPDVERRLGDVIVVPQSDRSLVYPASRRFEERFVSRHGGLTRAEMIVPWLGYRLEEPPPSSLDSDLLIR